MRKILQQMNATFAPRFAGTFPPVHASTSRAAIAQRPIVSTFGALRGTFSFTFRPVAHSAARK